VTLVLFGVAWAAVGYLARLSVGIVLGSGVALVAACLAITASGVFSDSPLVFMAATAALGVALGSAARRFRLWEVPLS